MFQRTQDLADYIVYDFLSLWIESHLWQALNFFIYDTIKIFLLLVVIIHIMTLINKYLPVEKIKNFLTKRNWYGLDNFFASCFWVVTPFCSCSSIPLFVGFLKSWVPLGVTLSFLITSPLVNEVAIAIFLWAFGVKITIWYVLAGIILWTFWWMILSKLWMDKYLQDFVKKAIKQWESGNINTQQKTPKFSEIWKDIIKESRALIDNIMPYVIIWIAVWWFIHGFVPTDFFEQYLTADSWYWVPIAVIIWIPMYANASGVIPIVQSLIAKWVPLWTWLAFMMAVVGLSLPEFLILKKVMKRKLLLSFFWIIWLFMILIWYIFNRFV